MYKKLEVFWVVILIVVGLIWGSSEVYLRYYADAHMLYKKAEKNFNKQNILTAIFFYKCAYKAGHNKAPQKLADYYFKRNNLTQAADWFILTNQPHQAGEIFINKDNIHLAIKYYQKAVDKNSIIAASRLLKIYRLQKKNDELKKLEKMIKSSKNCDELQEVTNFFYNNDYKEEALLYLKALVPQQFNGDYVMLANKLYNLKHYHDAIKMLKTKAEPNKVYIFPTMLGMCYEKIDDYQKAKQYYKIELYENYYDGLVHMYIHPFTKVRLANLYCLNKKYDLAIKMYNHSKSTQNVKNKVALSFIYQQAGRVEKSQNLLKELTKNPNNYASLGAFYNSIENRKKAIYYYKKSVEEGKNNDDAYTVVYLLTDEKKYSEALNYFIKYLNNSKSKYHKKNKAFLYGKTGDYDKAIDIYRKLYEQNMSYAIFIQLMLIKRQQQENS
ncbi:tetratricopeptide repeat protein [Lentisphaerota bacterium WC36G]|nr:hypothetical protein LJT99_12240 [Lentisphaerae bacterium WC36]